jgi:hypothetical protein
VVDDDGHKKMKMEWKKARNAGETVLMGMFASGTQKAILLQPKAKTDAQIDSASFTSGIARRRRWRMRRPSSWKRRPRRGGADVRAD